MKTTHTTPILYIDGIDLHQRELLEWIPYMSIPQRKALLVITRSQPTSRFSNTFQRTSADLSSPLSYNYDGDRLHPTIIRDTIFDTLLSSSSVFHGLVNMVARTAPFLCSEDEVNDALQSGISKEVSSALGSYPAVSLNWSSLFSSSPPSSVILGPGYPADVDLVVDIRQSVYRALKSLSRRTLVPDVSDKSCGFSSVDECPERLNMIRELGNGADTISTRLLEKLYSRTGFRLSGPTEMRFAWKYNELKPRVYYARGPDVYYSSRYIRAITNTLVDSMPVTHRQLRFDHGSIRPIPSETLFIYDYSSFTSNLEDLRNFVQALADYSSGIYVKIVDTYSGVMEVPLRDLLLDYNQACNVSPRIDLRRLYPDNSIEENQFYHTTGMLGVPGNIGLSTLMHGIHLLLVTGERDSKVVGDDAISKIDGTKDKVQLETVSMLQSIGAIEPAKMEMWDALDEENEFDSSWNYVKRPIDRVAGRVATGFLPLFPTMPLLLGVTPTFPRTVQGYSPLDRVTKIPQAIIAFVTQFSSIDVSEEDSKIIDSIVRVLTRSYFEARESIPHDLTVIRIFPMRFEGKDTLYHGISDNWNNEVTLPVLDPCLVIEEFWNYGVGSSFESHRTIWLSLAVKLGYMTSRVKSRKVVLRDFHEEVLAIWTRSFDYSHVVCEYLIEEDVPLFLSEMISMPIYSEFLDPMEDLE